MWSVWSRHMGVVFSTLKMESRKSRFIWASYLFQSIILGIHVRFRGCTLPETNDKSTWKLMVGILSPFLLGRLGLFSQRLLLVSGRVKPPWNAGREDCWESQKTQVMRFTGCNGLTMWREKIQITLIFAYIYIYILPSCCSVHDSPYIALFCLIVDGMFLLLVLRCYVIVSY